MQRIVTTSEALAELAARLAAAGSVALDTEFLRERTYRAQLCLVQLSAARDAVCVDPLALADLAPLGELLKAPQVCKVMHASRQDIEVLRPIAGTVWPVFDTQVAAGLAGLPPQIGYGELVRRLLGRELSKAHTRTDWSRRPLSAAQIEYALDDVRFLLPLQEQLADQLRAQGRLPWLAEDLEPLGDERSFTTDPAQAWARVKGLAGLDPGRTRLAQELAAWRERRAVERNRPRGWILEDTVLREIVGQVPRSLSALATLAPAGVVKHSGDEILACIRDAQVPDPPPALPGRARPDPAKMTLIKHLGTLTHAIAAELGVSPEVLATRRDLERLADGRQDAAVLRGWRRQIVGERLLAVL